MGGTIPGMLLIKSEKLRVRKAGQRCVLQCMMYAYEYRGCSIFPDAVKDEMHATCGCS